ncbi:hypothetical protein AAKU52_002684 [Pedobacter sp. CG_S7]
MNDWRFGIGDGVATFERTENYVVRIVWKCLGVLKCFFKILIQSMQSLIKWDYLK